MQVTGLHHRYHISQLRCRELLVTTPSHTSNTFTVYLCLSAFLARLAGLPWCLRRLEFPSRRARRVRRVLQLLQSPLFVLQVPGPAWASGA